MTVPRVEDPSTLSKPTGKAVHHVPLGLLSYEIDRRLAPVVTIAPGDSVVVETEDAFSGTIRDRGDRRDKQVMPYSNPVTGPIFIGGARPGDALRIRIISIDPLRGQCATYVPRLSHITASLGQDVPEEARICSIEEGHIDWGGGVRLPFRPMIGVIATAPRDGTPTTSVSGDYGGNMDLVDVAEGSTLSLPVFEDGGLLFLGDCHALQGQGEITAAALEMAATVTLTVDLVKNARIPGPRIETTGALAAVAIDRNLEQAAATAFGRLAVWLESDFGWNRWDAYSLLAQIGDISLGYLFGGIVAAKVPRSYVERDRAVDDSSSGAIGSPSGHGD